MTQNYSRIAVIAVHGVADQQPFETARSVAALLQSIGNRPGPSGLESSDQDPSSAGPQGPGSPADGPESLHSSEAIPGSRYSTFAESTLHVQTSPLHLMRRAPKERVRREEAPAETAMARTKRALRSGIDRTERAFRSGLYSSYGAKHFNGESERDAAPAKPDFDFMYNQVEQYTGSDDKASYQTVLLSGNRSPGQAGASSATAQPQARIDIYEMYWADLSRLGKGLLRILGEFYQLLFHVSSLGKTTVDFARVACKDAGALPYLGFFQAATSWLLCLPIAILNLYLVLLAAGLVLVKVPEEHKWLIAAAIGGTLVAIMAACLVYRRWRTGFWQWSLEQALAFGLGAALVFLLVVGLDASYPLLTAFWILLATLAVGALAARYESRRPGAAVVARVSALGILLAAFAFVGQAADQPGGVVFLIGRTSEVVFDALVVLWVLLVISNLLTWIAGAIVTRQTPSTTRRGGNFRDPRSQMERAVWTGRIALFLPPALFLILTLGLWMALLPAIGKPLAGFWYEPFTPFVPPTQSPVPEFIGKLVEQSAGPSFNAFFVLIAVALIMTIWGFFPAVLAEIAPPKNAANTSREIGHWLDHGFELVRWAGRVALFATLVVLPLGFAAVSIRPELQHLLGGDSLLYLIGGVLAGSTVGLVTLGSQLGKVFLGFRAPLDVALDVDNWLRERPLEANPCARICARYVSLLRHACEFRDENGDGYDALVIIAHSQGTVITADLLRFLSESPDPRLKSLGKELPVYLLTMGCPLRQLYGLRFPHLYQWATHDGDVVPGVPAPPSTAEYGLIPGNQHPDPGALRVELWANAFRSGDYVGRHLWLRDDHGERWTPATHDGLFVANDSPTASGRIADVNRVELCIGAGAHTHYFDETSFRVAQILDQLIGVAIVGKAAYPSNFPVFEPGT